MSESTLTTRAEHMAWCKQRALRYLNTPQWSESITSMMSDLGKHPDTANHAGIQLGMMLLMAGQLKTPDEMRKFIEGFN